MWTSPSSLSLKELADGCRGRVWSLVNSHVTSRPVDDSFKQIVLPSTFGTWGSLLFLEAGRTYA